MKKTPAGNPAPYRRADAGYVLRELESWNLDFPEMEKEGIRELHLEITHRCNLSCSMCHHWRLAGKDNAEMGQDDIERIVSGSRLLSGVKTVVLTGGEPFLRADLPRIAGMLSRFFPRASVGILSNFYAPRLIEKRLRDCFKAGVRNLWLGSSLDGPEATHDRMRGAENAHKNLWDTVSMLKREFPEVRFGFNYTMTPGNCAHLAGTYRFLKKRGIWLGAQRVVNHAGLPAERFSWKPRDTRAAVAQIESIISGICSENRLLEALITGKAPRTPWLWAELLYWKNLRSYMRRPSRLIKNCLAGYRYAMISPEGNLFFCPVRKHRVAGNALGGLDPAWKSQNARREREALKNAGCHCWLHCIANPAIERAVEVWAGKQPPNDK